MVGQNTGELCLDERAILQLILHKETARMCGTKFVMHNVGLL